MSINFAQEQASGVSLVLSFFDLGEGPCQTLAQAEQFITEQSFKS